MAWNLCSRAEIERLAFREVVDRLLIEGVGFELWSLGVRVQGSGFRVQGLGVGVWGLGFGV